MIPHDQVRAIKGHVDLRHLAGQWTDVDKRLRFRCLAPDHQDSHPSAGLFRGRDGWRWHCFACGAGGDALDFVERSAGVSFKEATRILANAAGIPLRSLDGTPDVGTRRRTLERRALRWWASEQATAATVEARRTETVLHDIAEQWLASFGTDRETELALSMGRLYAQVRRLEVRATELVEVAREGDLEGLRAAFARYTDESPLGLLRRYRAVEQLAELIRDAVPTPMEAKGCTA